MHKRISKNLATAIEQTKQLSNCQELERIKASMLLLMIFNQKGSYGKALLQRFNFDIEKIRQDCQDPLLTEEDAKDNLPWDADWLKKDFKDIFKRKDAFTKVAPPPVIKKSSLSAFDLIKIAGKMVLMNRENYLGTEHIIFSAISLPFFTNKFIKPKKQSNKNEIETPEIDPDQPGEMFDPFSLLVKKMEAQINSMQEHPPELTQITFFNKDKMSLTNFLRGINILMEHLMLEQAVEKENGKDDSIKDKEEKRKDSALDFFCNLLGQDDEQVLIGRAKELERMTNILGRKFKNNPVLIGDPGVGKTAIVEGLAQKINKGQVPLHLTDKKIYSLDLGLLIAGTVYRGEFEMRIKKVIEEAKQDPDVMLFIDEIHNLVGAGSASGAMDAANILKPALSRGEIQVIGATTIDEYRKYIEKDSALERRFQPILTPEPTIGEAQAILRGVKKTYEKYHNVTVTPQAIKDSVTLAKRYVLDRRLPDSAIDLIDETAAKKRGTAQSDKAYKKAKEIKEEIKNIEQSKHAMIWEYQTDVATQLVQMQKKAQENLKEIQAQLKQLEKISPIQVDEQDIRQTLALTTNIDAEFLTAQDQAIALRIKRLLQSKLISQDHVKKSIQNAALRSISGIANPNRPLGSFLFIGPTGVGKTLAAKLLAQAISPTDEPSLIQINMSEFMDRHSTSRLLGAPAGYVGYEEGGELVEKIRVNPYSVVLFDEIEKAEPNVLNILLQILEEGEITDAKGHKVSFKNAIIVLTSNIGTQELDEVSQLGFEIESSRDKKKRLKERENEAKQEIMTQLQQLLLPELTNRLDDILIFDSLNQKDLAQIVKLELDSLITRTKTQNIQLTVTKEVQDHLANKSLDPKQGARLVRKNVQDIIEPLVAQKLLSNRKKKIKKIKVSKGKRGLVAKVG